MKMIFDTCTWERGGKKLSFTLANSYKDKDRINGEGGKLRAVLLGSSVEELASVQIRSK